MTHLETAIKAAIRGGEKIMHVYKQDFEVEFKSDQSPLTQADKQANTAILETLESTAVPIISEEIKNIPYQDRSHWEACWVVDPLDGTKEFVKRNGEFTVNIALVRKGLPVLGVVYVPVIQKLYFAEENRGAFTITLENIETLPTLDELEQKAQRLAQQAFPKTYTVVASRSHFSSETEAFVNSCKEKHGAVKLVSKGSSLKLCMVAEGEAHVYPRIAPTMEWDTAAAHAVAKFAGCKVLNFNTKEELHYNKENLLNPYFIVLRKEDDYEPLIKA